jgi:putative membrane protein
MSRQPGRRRAPAIIRGVISGLRASVRRWFDPREVREVGTTPDYRFSLANERTFLAWIRTALALLGGGLAVAGFLPELHVPHLRKILAVALMLLGAAVAVRAVDHWTRCEAAIRQNKPLPPSRFPAILALTVAIGAVLLIAGAVLPGHQ